MNRVTSALTLGALFLFQYLPIVVVVVMSFNSASSVLRWEGFTLDWYASALASRPLMSGLAVTITVALAATLLAAVLGTLLAVGVHRYVRGPLGRALAVLPAFVPDIVLGIGVLSLFGVLKSALGIHSVILAHTVFEMALVAAVVLARLASVDSSLEEASESLGASKPRTFVLVLLPMLAPAIAAGAALGFTMSLDEFVIAFFTSSTGSQTLPIEIFSMVRFGVTPEINALATVLLALSVFAVLAAQRVLVPIISRRNS